jgi:hypothetical protein
MNKHRNLTSSDWLLLSAYLDDQLSEVEKRQVDERLQSDPECRKTLDSLKRTSLMLRSLPVHRVPRNFTLSAQSLSKKLIPSFVSILRFSSAAAALLLVAAFALDFMQKPALMIASKAAEDIQPAVAMEAAKMPAAEATEAEAPMIIFWGAPAPIMGAYGKGGGGGGAEGPGVGGGGTVPGFYGAGGGGGASEEALPEAAPLAEELPAAQATPYAEMPAPEVMESQQPETELQTQAAFAPEPLTGSGPILGVRSPEERTDAGEVVEDQLRQPAAQPVIPFQLIEIVLAALLVLTVIPAWLLRRK